MFCSFHVIIFTSMKGKTSGEKLEYMAYLRPSNNTSFYYRIFHVPVENEIAR